MIVKEHRDKQLIKLIEIAHRLDRVANEAGYGGIRITCIIRAFNPNKKSYHYGTLEEPKVQGMDIGTKEKESGFRQLIVATGMALRREDPTIQMDPHEELVGTPNEHIHFEIDDNTL